MAKTRANRNKRKRDARVAHYHNVVTKATAMPWVILPETLDTIQRVLTVRMNGDHIDPAEVDAAIQTRDSRYEPRLESGSQVALLNIYGVLSQRLSSMEAMSGGMSCEEGMAATQEALADPSVGTIVMNFDSPGGMVFGVEEWGDVIYEGRQQKRIVAVVNSLCASGAYWLASQCNEIVITPGGLAGSIGVYSLHVDATAADEASGYKVQIIRTPEGKAEGAYGEALTEEALAARRQSVNTTYARFLSAVARGRGVGVGSVEQGYGKGRVLHAEDSVRAGLADRIGTLQEVLADFGVTSVPDPRMAQSESEPQPFLSFEDHSMTPEILGALFRLGHVKSLTVSEDQATRALDEFFAKTGESRPADEAKVEDLVRAYAAAHAPVAVTPTVPAPAPAPVAPAAPQTNDDEDILGAIKMTSLSDARKFELASELRGKTLAEATKLLGDEVAKHQETLGAQTGRIEPVSDSRDNFVTEARHAMIARLLGPQGAGQQSNIWDRRQRMYVAFDGNRPANRRLGSLMGFIEEAMVVCGVPRNKIHELSPMEIAQVGLGKMPVGLDHGLYGASDGPAYNVSGMFSNILLDAQNVSLRRSYDEAPSTFQRWMRQGESVADFKLVNKVIAGELSDPKAVPENSEFEEQTLTDGKETYRLTVWGGVWSISWQAIVNDQLSSFSEVPRKQGTAMKRKQNKLAYQSVKDNPTLATDSTAVFHANHTNLTTGAGAPSVSTLNTLEQKMMEQTGLDSDSGALNLSPRFLLAPPALKGTVSELLASPANPAVGGSAAGNSGVINIWQNSLEAIIDAELGATVGNGGSDVAWYLAADNNLIDTWEYAYLQGLESPVMEMEPAFDRLAMRQRLYQAFAVSPLEYRGVQKHAGE